MTLPDKTLAFARSVGEDWTDKWKKDELLGFQQRYLYVHALAACHTARSYWILHREGQHNECHILARNLLERIFNSRVASKSPEHAVELIASEVADRIRRLRMWHLHQATLPTGMEDTIKRYEGELRELVTLLGTTTAPQWDFYRRAQEANITWAYRGLYSEFSSYTHAGYEVSRPGELNKGWKVADFIALLAPIDTARQLHTLSCSGAPCKVGEDYAALYSEIQRETLGEPISDA